MSGNLTDGLEQLLKYVYPSNVVGNSYFKNHPTLKMIKKTTNFGGRAMPVPVLRSIAANQGRTASTTFGYENTDFWSEFVVTRALDYGQAYIPREHWKAAVASNDKAFKDQAKAIVDNQIQRLMARMSRDLFRNGSGSFATVGAVSGTSLTLSPTGAARFVEIGDKIAVSAADGSGSLRDSGDTVTVSAVNRSTGVITGATAWSGISGIVVGDYVFTAGDHDNPTTGTKGLKGLSGWIPATAPTSGDSFFGLDRSTEPVRLAGSRYSLSGSLREGIFDAAVQLGSETDATPDVCIMHGTKWAELAKELEGDRIYGKEVKVGEFMFNGLEMNCPGGAIKIISDYNCPTTSAYLLTLDTWEFASLGAAPQIFEEGAKYIADSNADAYEVRLGWYGNLICRNPGQNQIITIS